MNEWLLKFGYGNMLVSPENIDVFWLEGESRITPFEQIDFLRRFYFKELPISERTHNIMKGLMVIESHDDWTLSGKTGWAIREGNNNGWFVGYLEKDNEVFFIATCIQPTEDFNMDMFNIIRRQLSMEAFRIMGIIK
jgi:beta-lactamase class D